MSARATAKALREQRAKLIADARKVLDKAEAEGRQPSPEEHEAWGLIMGYYAGPDGKPVQGRAVNKDTDKRVAGDEEKLLARIEQLEAQERAEAGLTAPAGDRRLGRDPYDGRNPDRAAAAGPSEEQRALAMQAWCRSQLGMELRDDHQEACRATGTNPQARDLVLSLRTDDYRRLRAEYRGFVQAERRAGANNPQAAGLVAAGGYTVPEGFVNNLEIALLQYGGIRDVADVMRTTSGNDLPWPTVNDTTVKGYLIGENQQVTGKDTSFGAIVFHAYKMTSGLVLVPTELMEDSAFNLASTLGDLMGVRIGRGQADLLTTGNGAAQPTGIVNAATLGVTAASATAIAADELYSLKHSVDPAYRKGPGVGWMFHDNTFLAIKKLKDGFGRYLWQTSLAGGAPDTIDNDPIHINQSMASSITNSAITILYGMLSKYKIRDVAEIRMRRLVERYADFDQEGFIMFVRFDGNLLDAGTHPVKYYQQHS